MFGVVMLMHQVGSFAGVWLGGLVAEKAGGYESLWLLDIGLALLAAALYLPFRRGRKHAARPWSRATVPVAMPVDRCRWRARPELDESRIGRQR